MNPITLQDFKNIYAKDNAAGLVSDTCSKWAYKPGSNRFATHKPKLLHNWLEYELQHNQINLSDLASSAPEEWWKLSQLAIGRLTQKILKEPYPLQTNLDKRNAAEYMFQTRRAQPNTFLDFGAGWCRSAILPNALNKSMTYVAVDGIEGSYILQNEVLNVLGNVRDYILEGEKFSIFESPEGKNFFHLPTWRMDLLPDNFFSIIVCIHVLQELEPQLVMHTLEIFRKIISKTGILYIQDCEDWKPVHNLNIDSLLEKNGWLNIGHYKFGESHSITHSVRLWERT